MGVFLFKISVVFPVFNVEKYINESLDSIVNQSLKDIEIICIDDGSTDNSLEILKEYASKDERIKIISQKNKGAGAARNVGLNHATGKYVYFMDGDDILNLNALEKVYGVAESKDLDLVIFKLINFDDGSNNKYTSDYYEMKFLKDKVNNVVFNYKDVMSHVFSIAVSPPGKLFKRDVISDIRFPEGVIYEDNVFFTEVLFNCERIFFIDEHLYNRRIRSDSVSDTGSLRYADAIFCLNNLIELTKKKGLFDTAFKRNLYNKKLNNLYYRLTLVDDNLKEDFFNKIKGDLMAKKTEYESDKEFFEVLSPRNKYIYDSFLTAGSYKECGLDVELYDSKRKSCSDNPKISIIMPIYNDAHIFKRAILSVANQTLGDIELVCINDGSTDDSLKVLEYISKKHGFIKVLTQENKGSGKARNYGMDESTGKYIAFLDADDYFIDDDALEKLFDVALKNDANMVSGNIKLVNSEGVYSPFKDLDYYVADGIINPEEYGIPWSFYKSIFKTEFIMNNKIYFPDLIRGQDPVFLAEVLSKVDVIYTVNTDVYAYYYVDGSNKCDTFIKRHAHIEHFKYVFKYFSDPKFDDVRNQFKRKLFIFIDMMGEEGAKDVLISLRDVFKDDRDLLKECEDYYYSKYYNNPDLLFELNLIENPKISVIIPVYNAEPFLNEAIDSVLNQSFKDIELVCVNDGSKDNSLALLNDYASKDARVKVIDQVNGGCGAARNRALDEASGDYIYFFDPDDYILPDTFEKLYENAISNDSDLVIFKIARFREGEPINYSIPGFDFDNVFKNVDFNNFTFDYHKVKRYVLTASFAPWTKLYKKEFLDKYDDFRFSTNVAFDDVPFHVQSMLRASKISFIPEFFYHYRYNPNSVNNTSSNGIDIFRICDIVESFLKDERYYSEFENEFVQFKVTQVLNYLISTGTDEYFCLAKKEFSNLNLNNVILNDYQKDRLEVILNSSSMDDYKRNLHEFLINKLNLRINSINAEKNSLESKVRDLEENNKNLSNLNIHLKNEINSLKNESSDELVIKDDVEICSLIDANNDLTKEYEKNKKMLDSILASRSWRYTKFLRSIANWLRKILK